MEPLPRGSQFKRAKLLWEIGLHLAGDPSIPYDGDRDLAIHVGSGSGRRYRPALRMSVGSPILAHAVAEGELEAAFVNPSALLTQAYRGTGLFDAPLPVRVLACYPSWDRCVQVIHPRAGITSLAEIKARRPALRISIREDVTHSTRVLLDQLLAWYDLTLDDLLSWGGTLQLNGPPGDPRRLAALRAGEVDLAFDEGIIHWFPEALAAGYTPLPFEPALLDHLAALGWRRVVLPAGRFPGLLADYTCLDYSGWPLYTRASLPDDDAYRICAAIAARADEIPWEDSYTGLDQLGRESEATPLDVPLHPGAARWYRERARTAPP